MRRTQTETHGQAGAGHDAWVLWGEDLSGCDLRDAAMERAELWEADLRDADLRGADLRGADLRGASLDGADLRGATLDGATLDGASLGGARLHGATVEGSSWVGVRLPRTEWGQAHGRPHRAPIIEGGFRRPAIAWAAGAAGLAAAAAVALMLRGPIPLPVEVRGASEVLGAAAVRDAPWQQGDALAAVLGVSDLPTGPLRIELQLGPPAPAAPWYTCRLVYDLRGPGAKGAIARDLSCEGSAHTLARLEVMAASAVLTLPDFRALEVGAGLAPGAMQRCTPGQPTELRVRAEPRRSWLPTRPFEARTPLCP